MGKPLISALIVNLVVLPLLVSAEEEQYDYFGFAAALNSATALECKIIAIFATLIVGVFGVCFAIFGLHVDGLFFFLIRPLGSCVISVACILYIVPDAKKSLKSSCIGDFPMSTAAVAMAAAILTMIESKSFMNRRNQNGDQTHDGSVSVSVSHNKIRPNLLTQILELGIVVHSVIIGISLGASQNVSTVKSLTAAITFHQLFQGVGLGGCISQTKFEFKKSIMMAIVFGLTTPVGIGIGIGVAEIYGPTTFTVSGFLKAAAAGILLYKAGVTECRLEVHTNRFDMLLACLFVLPLLPF